MSRYIQSILHAVGAVGLFATVMAGCTFFLAPEDVRGAQETSPAVDPGYRLGAEDVVLISVWKDEQLTREVVVRPDGAFSFPLVGDVLAEDRTVEELRAALVKSVKKFILNLYVSV